MWIRYCILIMIGLCAGNVVAGGVFSVAVTVGLLPRFAGKTNTADHILLYEDMIMAGNFTGLLTSVFFYENQLPTGIVFGTILLAVYGFFTGTFVGCLAVAIAEILDVIPIFARRVRLKKGIGLAIATIGAGKMVGALFYYLKGVYGW